MRSVKRFGIASLLPVALITMIGCSGGTASAPAAPTTYTVAGTISGLTGTGLVLQNNGKDSLTVGANAASFTFAAPVSKGGQYSVTLLSQPAGQSCTVANANGAATASVTNVKITCIGLYTIGGTVSGLTNTGLALQDNGGDTLTLGADATGFTFATLLASGAAYTVSLLSQPPGEMCTLLNPTGTVTSNVTTVSVMCIQTYTIAGIITGLTGTGLVLQDNGGNDLMLSAKATNFAFAAQIASGGTYGVTVLTQPSSQNCTVTNGTGGAVANVTNVSIVCVGDWAWQGGSSTVGFNGGQSGIYGTLGSAGPNNVPGGRTQPLTWTDASGALWLFGGNGPDAAGTTAHLNDLWKFDAKLGTSGEWTWISGSSIATPPASSLYDLYGQAGNYGTIGVASPTNVPGGREQSNSWKDAAGNLWLFGGNGVDGVGTYSDLNDLWKFDPTLGARGEWTWMAGNSTSSPILFHQGRSGVYGTLGTADASNNPGSRSGAVSWKDLSGNFWIYGGDGIDSMGRNGYLNDLWKYTPATNGTPGTWTWMGGGDTIPLGNSPDDIRALPGAYGNLGMPDPTNIPGGRGSGTSWTDPSGTFWLFGGLGSDSAGTIGYLNDLWKFDPKTAEWTWMGGSDTISSSYSGQPGVYGIAGTPSAANEPGGRFSPASWVDSSGNLWLAGGQGFDWTGTSGYLNDLWKYTPNATGGTGAWTWMGGSDTIPPSPDPNYRYGQLGIYGTLGTPAPANAIGGRVGAASWTDASGNLWLFGGLGIDSLGSQGYLNDLWQYHP